MSNAKKNRVDHEQAEPANRLSVARDRTGSLMERATGRIDASPLALVAGALTVGAAVGALLPRSDRERTLLAPVGQRVGQALEAAIDAGREAGKAELDELGISRDAARDQARTLVEGLVKAVATAGSAAASAAAGGGGTATR